MNKSVITSVSPRECELIASRRQTMLVRKTRPKIETPFREYIYCTKGTFDITDCPDLSKDSVKKVAEGRGKVIGSFVCDRIEEFHEWQLSPSGKFQEYEQRDLDRFLKESCISFEDVCEYRRNMPYYKPLYGWHISDLKIYDKPKELGEFRKEGFMTEEQWLCALYPNTHCHYEAWAKRFEIKRLPQSWVYCEPIEEE